MLVLSFPHQNSEIKNLWFIAIASSRGSKHSSESNNRWPKSTGIVYTTHNLKGVLPRFNNLLKVQRQPPEVFCKKRYSLKFHKIHRKTPLPPLTQVFPVNFVKFLRTSFLQNASGQLLLKVGWKHIFVNFLKTKKLKPRLYVNRLYICLYINLYILLSLFLLLLFPLFRVDLHLFLKYKPIKVNYQN